jgi:hypothetical protein
MPMVLMSGWIAADALDGDRGLGRCRGGPTEGEPVSATDPVAADA